MRRLCIIVVPGTYQGKVTANNGTCKEAACSLFAAVSIVQVAERVAVLSIRCVLDHGANDLVPHVA